MCIPLLRRTGFTLLIVLLSVVPASAQEPAGFPLTFGGGYEAGNATVDFSSLDGYGDFEDGEIAGFTLGIGIGELPMSRVTDRPFFRDLVILPGVFFRSTNATFAHGLPEALVLLPGSSTPVRQRVENRLTLAVQDIGLDLQVLYNVWEGLGIKSGVEVGYRSIPQWKLTQHLIEPANARFVNPAGYPAEEEGRVLVMSNGSDIEVERLSTVSTASLLYDLSIGDRLSIVPEIGVSGHLNHFTLVTGGSWSRFAFAGNLSIRYLFGSDEPVPTPVLPPIGMVAPEPPSGSIPPADSLAPPKPLTASIDLFTLDGDTRRQTMQLVTTQNVRKQEVELVPEVAFENGSRTLAARYSRIDSAAADYFSLDSLARLDAEHVRSHLLNVVGSRLRQFPRQKIRLIVSRDQAAAGRARAEAIRVYLKDVWGIAPSRLSIETGAGTPAGESVRLGASRKILAPLAAEWIEQRVVAAPLQIDPRIEGGVGLRSWRLTLRRGDVVVASHTSEETTALTLDLALGTPVPGEVPAPLSAELTVSDSSGAMVVARDTIELVTASGSIVSE